VLACFVRHNVRRCVLCGPNAFSVLIRGRIRQKGGWVVVGWGGWVGGGSQNGSRTIVLKRSSRGARRRERHVGKSRAGMVESATNRKRRKDRIKKANPRGDPQAAPPPAIGVPSTRKKLTRLGWRTQGGVECEL